MRSLRCENEPWTTGRRYLHCRNCGSEVSLTAGTVFDHTRLLLTTWFAAAWFLVSQEEGASALGLKRILGLGSYQTAWTWLYKLRHGMMRPGLDKLSGRVEG
jgi:hypothetical protein